VKKYWRERCEQLLDHEEALEEKDSEIMLLKVRILWSTTGEGAPAGKRIVDSVQEHSPSFPEASTTAATSVRRGKAPPVDPYSGENPDVLWEEWLLIFNRAASWNGWTESDKLLQ